MVDTEVVALLRDTDRILNILAPYQLTCPEQQALMDQTESLCKRRARLTSADKIKPYGLILTKIILTRRDITLHFSASGLLSVLLPQHPQPEAGSERLSDYALAIPIHLKRCGVETKLIVEKPIHRQSLQSHSDSKRAIQVALKKALLWNDALLTGQYSSMRELAANNGVTQRYIAQIIKLANLSPTIIRRICAGDIPHHLTLGDFKKSNPVKWQEQEALLLANNR